MDNEKNDYISCEIMGGLGNQLFQIANVIIYKELIDENKEIVFKYEENLYNHYNIPRNTYWHSLFKNQFNVLKEDEYNKISFMNINEIVGIKSLLNTYVKCPFNIKFNGYFQSFRPYDEKIRTIMRNYIYSNKELVQKAQYLYDEIKTKMNANDDSIISIHFRRTDYILSSDHHYNLQLDYYKQALEIAEKRKAVIFSDDIQWCKDNFSKDVYGLDDIYFVDINDTVIEFLLMSMFKNNIIANSTFSLWASYISDYKDKIIIAPRNWFVKEKATDWSEIYHEYITDII